MLDKKFSNIYIYLTLFMVLLCCFSAVSASEEVTDDIVSVSDDVAVDEVVSAVDSNDEELESVDDSGNDSLAVQDEEQVNDVEEVDSTLTAENDNGQTLLGTFNDEILGDLERNVDDVDSFWDAFETGSVTRPDDEPQVVHIIISPGDYISDTFDEGFEFLSLHWENMKVMPQGEGAPVTVYSYYEGNGLLYRAIFILEGDGDVIFNYNNILSFDLKGSTKNNDFGTESIYHDISIKNIIFDCDVDVGSRNFEFINCTFKKSLSINGWNIDEYWNYNYGENCNVVNNITFTDCTFDFNKDDVALNKAQDEHLAVRENSFNINYINANFTDGIFNTADEKSDDNETGNATSDNGTSTNTGNASSGNATSNNPGKTTTVKKVTKKATKITAKKATFKKSKKVKKYTITLKAGKAAVKKVKVTIKIGKKTYKATTNSKGKATFKITKLTKKGKYTAVIKFAGNKNFKPTSKKVKITVKK